MNLSGSESVVAQKNVLTSSEDKGFCHNDQTKNKTPVAEGPSWYCWNVGACKRLLSSTDTHTLARKIKSILNENLIKAGLGWGWMESETTDVRRHRNALWNQLSLILADMRMSQGRGSQWTNRDRWFHTRQFSSIKGLVADKPKTWVSQCEMAVFTADLAIWIENHNAICHCWWIQKRKKKQTSKQVNL